MPKILFTRLIDDSSHQKLRQAGIDFDEIDFITINPTNTEGVVSEIRTGLSEHLVFTSRHAIHFFFKIIEQEQILLAPATLFYTLAWSSSAALQKFGYYPTLVADSAQDLAEKIALRKDIRQISFICGNRHSLDLPTFLRTHHIAIQELMVYQTEYTPLSIESIYDAIVFFSPSAIDSFLIQNQLSPTLTYFAIGKTTAAHLNKKTSPTQVIVAHEPILSAIVESILKRFKHSLF